MIRFHIYYEIWCCSLVLYVFIDTQSDESTKVNSKRRKSELRRSVQQLTKSNNDPTEVKSRETSWIEREAIGTNSTLY